MAKMMRTRRLGNSRRLVMQRAAVGMLRRGRLLGTVLLPTLFSVASREEALGVCNAGGLLLSLSLLDRERLLSRPFATRPGIAGIIDFSAIPFIVRCSLFAWTQSSRAAAAQV